MSNPSLFFAIAGISMSFAGFAGLFIALRPRDTERRRYEVGQINSIILFAMTALFSALLVVPLVTLVGEVTAFRAMSAVVLVLAFYGHQVRFGTSWLRWSKVEMVLPRREMLIQGALFAIVATAGSYCSWQPSSRPPRSSTSSR